jgi:hypothetical protein
MDILAPFQPQSPLGAQIKETDQFASKGGRVVCAQAAQRLELSRHRIESSFIEAADSSSKLLHNSIPPTC